MMTAKGKNWMFICIANEGGYFEKDIVDPDGDSDSE